MNGLFENPCNTVNSKPQRSATTVCGMVTVPDGAVGRETLSVIAHDCVAQRRRTVCSFDDR